MLTKYSLYNESEMRQWNEFVKSHPKGSPFHLSWWMRAIYETYSFKPLLYVLKDSNGDINSIFPCFLVRSLLTGSRIVSLPFSDYGGPLSNAKYQENELLTEILKKKGYHVKYIEIRSSLSEGSSLICHKYYKRHLLDLCPDLLALKRNINKRTIQYSIRKAEKAGVEIREENSQWGMEEFYRLNMLTRKKHGVPFQPVIFFKNMYDYLVSNGLASILLAISDSKTIAAGILLKFKDTVYYKYNASDPQYLSKKTPNHLLTMRAIEQAYLKGYRFFDFGRTAPDNEGLMRYKKMWGAEPVDLPYYYYPRIKGTTSSEESGSLYRILTGIWRSLPNEIVEYIGPKIYRYLA